jgi:competence protein ComEA
MTGLTGVDFRSAGHAAMSTAVTPVPPAGPPQPAPPGRPPLWPRSAQLALAVLLGSAATLLAVHLFGSLRYGSRPAELQPDHALGQRIDLNQAGRAELLQLPGVGENLAGRIQEYRQQHGGFRNVEELRGVQGVGPATLERLRPWVFVHPGDSERDEEKIENPPPAGKIPAAGKSNASSPTAALPEAPDGSRTPDVFRDGPDDLRPLSGSGAPLRR